jgi:chemotaxis protein CheX
VSDLNEEEIKVFTDAVAHYFDQLTREPAAVRGAYLEHGGETAPVYDFSGRIEISGMFRGSVTVSAPRAMVRHLLAVLHETDQSEASLRDTVGELANTLAGNARRHFGENMEISVPVTALGAIPGTEIARERTYVIMVNWKAYNAVLLVDIERAA